MGCFSGPETIEDNLILALDSANTKSYSGSGNTWYDLSGKGNNGTISGATHTSGVGGYFSFDGSNDVISVTSESGIVGQNEITVETFLKVNGDTSNASWQGQYLIFRRNSRTSYFEGFTILYNQSNDQFGAAFADSSGTQKNAYSTSTFSSYPTPIVHVAATFKTNDHVKIYINGVLENTTSHSLTLDLTNADTLQIGDSNEGWRGYSNASIYNIKVYNKVLSASEIQQNFNALRGRFGI